MTTIRKTQKLWWIATNGNSCAKSPWAMSYPFDIAPIPQWIAGFKTKTEAIRAQNICLTASIEHLEEECAKWRASEHVIVIAFQNAEPMTKGPTCWSQIAKEISVSEVP